MEPNYPFVTTTGDDGIPHVRLSEGRSSRVDTFTAEMIKLAGEIPEELLEAYTPTLEQSRQTGYTQLGDEQVIMHSPINRQDVVHDHLQYFSPQKMHELGLMPNMLKLREGYSKKERLPQLRNLQLNAHRKRGSSFNMNLVFNYEKSIYISDIATANQSDLTELNTIVAKTAMAVAMAYASEPVKAMWKRTWAAESSLCFGDEDNYIFSSFLLNLTDLTVSESKPPGGDTKGKGDVHTDKGTDPGKVMVMLFVSNTPADYHPGNFFITSTRFWCPAAFGGALVLSGRHPYGASTSRRYPADLPMDSPLRYHQSKNLGIFPLDEVHHIPTKISIPVYAAGNLTRVRALQPIAEPALWNPIGLGAFSTLRNQRETHMRVKIKESIAKSQQIATDLEKIAKGTMHLSEQSWNGAVIDFGKTAEDWCDQYAWRNSDGNIEKPRLWVAQLCLKLTGTKDEEYKKRKEAIISTTCGIRAPKAKARKELDKNQVRALWVMKREGQVGTSNTGDEEKGVPEKVQCEGFGFKDKRCANKFWRLPGGEYHCVLHREDP